MLRTFAFVLALVSMGACASNNHLPANPQFVTANWAYQPISGHTLQRFVKGRSLGTAWGEGVIVAFDPPRFEDRIWAFEADGQTFSAGGVTGTYRIVGSAICVRLAASFFDYCFGIGRARDGQLYRVYTDGRTPEPVRML
jgi:hypothetical protein